MKAKTYALIKIRASLLSSIRRFFNDRGWIEVTVPTIANIAGSCEDPSTLFSLDYFGETAYLIQTSQLHLETLIQSFDKVISVNHSYRAEPEVTARHLTEFTLVEVEATYLDLSELLNIQEQLIKTLCKDIVQERIHELQFVDANVLKLQNLRTPFDRITYTEAVKRLRRKGISLQPRADLNVYHKEILGKDFDGPFFITHHPKEIKFFNMKEDPERPTFVMSSDLILPVASVTISASVREDDPEKLRSNLLQSDLIRKAAEKGVDPSEYEWYLELYMKNPIPHAGFGLGFERLVQWICNEPDITECIEFPRNTEHLAGCRKSRDRWTENRHRRYFSQI